MTAWTSAPACACRDPLVFGHTGCPLGPPWVIEAERRLVAMTTIEQRRRWSSWAWARPAPGIPRETTTERNPS